MDDKTKELLASQEQCTRESTRELAIIRQGVRESSQRVSDTRRLILESRQFLQQLEENKGPFD